MKVVEKPWGREEWLVVTGKYCLKRLYINEGHRLSLQYHKVKLETMFLEEGVCDLVIVGRTRLMEKGQPYTIKPNEVHRLIARKDSVILEVSTPELNDVVRLQDDYQRKRKKPLHDRQDLKLGEYNTQERREKIFKKVENEGNTKKSN